jgi:hypothetical protein
MRASKGLRRFSTPVFLLLSLASCQQKMSAFGHLKPDQEHPFFSDRRASRPRLPDTVARDEALTLTQPPISGPLLLRGQERFGIYCAPCHGALGDGHGRIVSRGFLPPPTYHQPRLRSAPDSHFYDVITHGFGAMYSYGDRVPPQDRWAIIAYIRALQLSQNFGKADQMALTDQERSQLERLPR